MIRDHGIVFALIILNMRNVEIRMMGRKNMPSWKLMAALFMAFALLAPGLAEVTTVQSGLRTELSSALSQHVIPPWDRTISNHHDSTGFMKLVLGAADLIKFEYVKVWRFTLDPTLEPKGILICQESSPLATVPST
jgi:hypothetical protein